MEILQITAISLVAIWFLFYLTWTYYIAFMSIKDNLTHIKKNKFDYYSMYPHFLFGYLIDILLNFTYGTIRFLEIPREWTLSGRIIRHQKADGWRKKLAYRLCNRYLKPFDPTHCL